LIGCRIIFCLGCDVVKRTFFEANRPNRGAANKQNGLANQQKGVDMYTHTVKMFITVALMVLGASCNGLIGQIRQGINVDSKERSNLGVGILMMEGSALEVSKEQAQSLLPLWKAIKNLSNDNSIPEAEMTAVYRQILETMTAEQMQELQGATWTDADFNTVIQKYGAQSASATSSAELAASGVSQSHGNAALNPGGGMPVGGLPAGGAPGGDLAGGLGAGEMGAIPQSQNPASAPMASDNGTSDLNFILADTVISVLQQHMDA
jgi:hypothetical protein